MRSREQITEDFMTQFDASCLPEPTELLNFLEQHELGCFIKKDALIFFKNDILTIKNS